MIPSCRHGSKPWAHSPQSSASSANSTSRRGNDNSASRFCTEDGAGRGRRETNSPDGNSRRANYRGRKAIRNRHSLSSRNNSRSHHPPAGQAMISLDQLAELERDKARLDGLEREVEDSPLLLHNGCVTKGFRGLGLKNTNRSLRKAIDDML